MKFFECKHCHNFVGTIIDAGVPMHCCGEVMGEVVPNTVDAASEKHLPLINVKCKTVTVTVGEVAHPMTEEHSIEWVYLETTNGGQRKKIAPGSEPVAVFKLDTEKAVAAYSYCNLHGLWKTEK